MAARKTIGRGPNRSTLNARTAIGALVDGNIHRLEQWLDDIANDPEQGPREAWRCMMDVIEYHVPKLARLEHTGEGGGAIKVTVRRLSMEPKSPLTLVEEVERDLQSLPN